MVSDKGQNLRKIAKKIKVILRGPKSGPLANSSIIFINIFTIHVVVVMIRHDENRKIYDLQYQEWVTTITICRHVNGYSVR